MSISTRPSPRLTAALRCLVPALICLVTGLAAPSGADADEFYRWQDERGRWHFSDSPYDVPARYRDQIDQLRDDFEEDAPVSVVEGLDQRYVPPASQRRGAETPRQPAGGPGGLDWSKLQQMQRSPREMLAAVPTSIKLAMAAGLVVMLGVGLLLGGFLLKVACHLASQEPPALAKAMGIVFVQGLVATAAQLTLQVALVSDASSVSPTRALGVAGLNMLLGFSINVAILRGMLTDTLGRALVVQILVILIAVVAGVTLALSGLVLSCAMA